jgi:hypothetical protein
VNSTISPSGGGDVDRFAIAVVGLAVLFAGALQPPLQLIIGFGLGLECDVVVTADLRRPLGLGQLVHFRVGELEEGEGAAIAHGEKGMAEFDLLLHFRAEVLLAPGRNQRNPEEILEEAAVDLVVADHEGVVVQARRKARQQPGGLGLARAFGLDCIHFVLPCADGGDRYHKAPLS